MAFAASPAIFYSDLDSGPNTGGQNNKGAFVTIWGKNFGATRGSSYVSIGGGQADNYPVWSDTKISFQLGSNAATGNITVTASSGTSNGVFFTVRTGNIYFVSTSGDNGNNGSYTTPWRTWIKSASTIAAGDIVYGRGGNYTTSTDKSWVFSRGFELGTYPGNGGGTAGNPKAFVAYPGETPILYPIGVSTAIIQIYDGSYYTIAGLSLYNPSGNTDVTSILTSWNSDGNTDITHLRIVGNVCGKNYLGGYALGASIQIGNANNVYIAGNQVFNVGVGKQTHGIYLTPIITDTTVEYNTIYSVNNGHGIEVYGDFGYVFSNLIIRNNLVYNCGRSGIQVNAPSTCKIYNNIVYGNGIIDFAGINLRWGNASSIYEVYNNTLYNNGIYTADDGNRSGGGPYGQVYFNATCQSFIFRNNIIRSFSSNEVYFTRSSTSGTQTFSNNLYYGNGGKPSFDNGSSTLNTDPLFNNPTSDFNLQSSSPTINAGYDISGIVTRDYDGVTRPQGAGVDIGAYEYAVDSTPPAAVTDLGASSVTGSTVVLGWTAPGNDGNSGKAASYDIRYSTSPITNANWASATQVSGEPSPSSAGTIEIFTVSGLTTNITYYFALKTTDYAGNTSSISDIASAATSSTSSGGGGGGGGGGCFIATAVYGSTMAKEEQSLIIFRDKCLLKNKTGKKLVEIYYKISPPIATYIGKREWARQLMRIVLKPVVWIAKKMIEKRI